MFDGFQNMHLDCLLIWTPKIPRILRPLLLSLFWFRLCLINSYQRVHLTEASYFIFSFIFGRNKNIYFQETLLVLTLLSCSCLFESLQSLFDSLISQFFAFCHLGTFPPDPISYDQEGPQDHQESSHPEEGVVDEMLIVLSSFIRRPLQLNCPRLVKLLPMLIDR